MKSLFKMNRVLLLCMLILSVATSAVQAQKPKFKVIAFYTGKNDQAHISYVREASKWFPEMAAKYHFSYDSTSNWKNMNEKFLSQYQVVLFLDTRPEDPEARAAFQKYMEKGGAWMGFHFAAFALAKSAIPDNWDWYHQTFLGSGGYGSNTWRPTSAILRVEDAKHPSTKGLPKTFKSSPNEWYRWQNDLTKNKDIDIVLAIDSSSFPLGTGPKAHEIWHSGYYPVAWSNKKFKMMYVNMGHNDIDYEGKTNKDLSLTFDNETQNKFIVNTLLWLGNGKKK